MDPMILRNVEMAAKILREGNPVAMPTETVYGLAAPIFDEKAVKKIFSLKKRPADNPLIAHVSSLSMVESVAKTIPDEFFRLADAFWPGPLAMILPKKECVPYLVSGGLETLAIRMPSHPLALQLIDAVGEPLVAPSANRSGRPSPTCVAHVLEDLECAVLDGGSCSLGIESTILNLSTEIPALLRPGKITQENIEEVLKRKIVKSDAAICPGMKYRHYAPTAEVRLCTTWPPNAEYVLTELTAKSLYAKLREADRKGVKVIWVLLDSAMQQNEALMNRLLRATEVHSHESR